MLLATTQTSLVRFWAPKECSEFTDVTFFRIFIRKNNVHELTYVEVSNSTGGVLSLFGILQKPFVGVVRIIIVALKLEFVRWMSICFNVGKTENDKKSCSVCRTKQTSSTGNRSEVMSCS